MIIAIGLFIAAYIWIGGVLFVAAFATGIINPSLRMLGHCLLWPRLVRGPRTGPAGDENET